MNNVFSFMIAQADPTGQTVPPADAPPGTERPATETGTTANGQPEAERELTPGPWWATNPLIPVMLILVIFLLYVSRSKRTQDRKRQDMLSQLRKGERVQTIGGILGTVVEVRDTEVLVKVDESSNTKIRFARSAIHRVLEDEGK